MLLDHERCDPETCLPPPARSSTSSLNVSSADSRSRHHLLPHPNDRDHAEKFAQGLKPRPCPASYLPETSHLASSTKCSLYRLSIAQYSTDAVCSCTSSKTDTASLFIDHLHLKQASQILPQGASDLHLLGIRSRDLTMLLPLMSLGQAPGRLMIRLKLSLMVDCFHDDDGVR